jgi:hypothetical protein
LDGKQAQQHRQHFNLSETAKQMLEELTAQRYPGKQRRQSQLVEDLITEAFMKERSMSTLPASAPGSDRFAPSTLEALNLAQQEATHMQANAVYPEHLLLGVIAQGESKAARQLCFVGMDMPALRLNATEFFKSHYIHATSTELAFASDAQECLRQSIALAERGKAPLVLPEHVVLSVLNYDPMQEFFTPFVSSLNRLVAELAEEVRGVQEKSPHQKVREALQQYTVPPSVQQYTVSPSVNQPRLCPSCKREAQPNWKHCVFCGIALERLCPRCSTPQPQIEGARFCFACGSQLT